MASSRHVGLIKHFVSAVALVSAGFGNAATQDTATQAVNDWNAIGLRTTKTGAPAIPAMRNLAMMHMAISDSLNAVEPRHRMFFYQGEGREVPALPAAATAAHDVLVALYPKEQERLDQDLASSLKQVPDSSAKAQAVELGKAVAKAALQARAHDGMTAPSSYSAVPTDGVWRPTPGDGIAPTNAPRGPDNVPPMGVSWAKMQPLVLAKADQFRPGPPPALDSDDYARDFNELIEVGAANSSIRTKDQTDAAMFWRPTPDTMYNPLIQRLVVAKGLDAWDAAHVFALANIAMVDAVIATWDAKFVYNQWRPITGIRNALESINPTTKAVPDWSPLLFTPPYPDYPGGHPAAAAAMARVLEYVFGKAPGEFSVTSAGKSRSFDTFAAFEQEVIDARVWGGVHWRTSDTAAATLGTNVATYILQQHGQRLGQ